MINHVVVVFENNVAVGCGAIKSFDHESMEVKRMFVKAECRGLGIGAKILIELENWCRELDFKRTVLETGIKQPEAVKLYVKCGYQQIPNYGQYKNAASSICFAKDLNPIWKARERN